MDENDEDRLRQKAREVIGSGTLPDRRPDRTWGGPGTGLTCVVCGQSLMSEESELELEFFERNGRLTYHLHFPCFDAWELERASARRPANGDGLSAVKDRGTIWDRERDSIYRRGRT